MNQRALVTLVALLLALPAAGADRELLLATTTSVRDSGLLDELLPVFREETGIRVRAVAVGTGAALRMGADGNADVLLTHAPEPEQELVESGALRSRHPFMENHFVLAGPPGDPAHVADAPTAADAYRRLAAANAAYLSRGDDSGTHKREVGLLRAAGLDPTHPWPAVARTGSGMGLTLQVAGERRAYVLSDLGTFLAFQQRIGLVPLSRPAPDLRNVYSVLRAANSTEARAFESFLLAPATQQRIARFGRERFGQTLFRPLHLPEGPE